MFGVFGQHQPLELFEGSVQGAAGVDGKHAEPLRGPLFHEALEQPLEVQCLHDGHGERLRPQVVAALEAMDALLAVDGCHLILGQLPSLGEFRPQDFLVAEL